MNTKYSKAVDLADGSPVNAEATIMMPAPAPEEHRTRKVTLHLKPSEYDTFVSHIGRETVSNALRDLVLLTNRRKHEQKK